MKLIYVILYSNNKTLEAFIFVSGAVEFSKLIGQNC